MIKIILDLGNSSLRKKILPFSRAFKHISQNDTDLSVMSHVNAWDWTALSSDHVVPISNVYSVVVLKSAQKSVCRMTLDVGRVRLD